MYFFSHCFGHSLRSVFVFTFIFELFSRLPSDISIINCFVNRVRCGVRSHVRKVLNLHITIQLCPTHTLYCKIYRVRMHFAHNLQKKNFFVLRIIFEIHRIIFFLLLLVVVSFWQHICFALIKFGIQTEYFFTTCFVIVVAAAAAYVTAFPSSLCNCQIVFVSLVGFHVFQWSFFFSSVVSF